MNNKQITSWIATGLHLLGVPLALFIARGVLGFIKAGSYNWYEWPLDFAFSAIAYDFTALGLSIRTPGVPVVAGSTRMVPSQPSMFILIMAIHFVCFVVALIPFMSTTAGTSVILLISLSVLIPVFTWGLLLWAVYILWSEQRTTELSNIEIE